MLVLSRKQLESVAVGKTDDIGGLLKVTVLEIEKGRVRLGFEASADVFVHRWEIWECIQTEKPLDKTP